MLTPLVTSTCLVLLLGSGAATAPPNLDEAIASQQRLVEESPTPDVINDLANLMVLAGRYDEAERLYRRALSLDATDGRAEFNLGLLLQSRDETAEALELFEDVVAHEPRHAWAHYQIGVLYERLGDDRSAVASYARAFALDPELYFADVNPQVVANHLLTESILEAARLRRSSTLAPMQYAQPREVTQLLLSLPDSTSQAAEQSESSAEAH